VTAPPTGPSLRCAVHPGRPAVDQCPVCGRPRCGADVAAVAVGCLACATERTETVSTVRPPGDLELLVRATLAAYAVALLGAPVGSEYVGATVFEYLGPFVVGMICGGAATKAAQTDGRGRLGQAVRAISAVVAVLGIAYAFLLEQSQHVVSGSPHVLLPYAAAVAGALLWTLPPRRKRTDQGLSTDV
jgi:peptidoglycan/LPS O-acetylase OafA/YrhL